MRLYNYTTLKSRDTKLYNIGGYSIAGGLSIEFLKVVLPIVIVFILLGYFISIPFGLSFFNPLATNFSAKYTIIWLALGIGVGCALWYIQFSGYRLYQYLIAYFKPKKVYTNQFKTTEYRLYNFSIKTFFKTLL